MLSVWTGKFEQIPFENKFLNKQRNNTIKTKDERNKIEETKQFNEWKINNENNYFLHQLMRIFVLISFAVKIKI